MERIVIHIMIEDFDLADLKELKAAIEELLEEYPKKTVEVSTIPTPPTL